PEVRVRQPGCTEWRISVSICPNHCAPRLFAWPCGTVVRKSVKWQLTELSLSSLYRSCLSFKRCNGPKPTKPSSRHLPFTSRSCEMDTCSNLLLTEAGVILR